MSEMDSREKSEAAVRGSTAITTSDVLRWLDRQAAITERELRGCPGYDAERHYCKYHATDFELTREQVCDLRREVSRLERERDELQAKLDQCMESYADAKDSRDYLRAQLDEYNETHMLLPLDAYGVPIRPGDLMVCTALDKNDYDGKENVFAVAGDYWVDKDNCTHMPSETLHVKPCTVEDVLEEFFCIASLPSSDETRNRDEIVSDYADELRELMGVE